MRHTQTHPKRNDSRFSRLDTGIFPVSSAAIHHHLHLVNFSMKIILAFVKNQALLSDKAAKYNTS